MTSDTHILIATRNKGKVKEIRDLVQGLPIEFRSMTDFPDLPDVEEDGVTFEENALKKARTLSRETGLITLADDSGLCVDALDGRPGVLSARYGGEDLSDEEKCRRLLHEMDGVPDELRTARFVCVMALVDPNGMERTFEGVCEGKIIHELRGSEGFGYDPIFLYEEAGQTFAEMDRTAKNRVSHRGKALKQVGDFLHHKYP
ncbi:XTP/dITP diphosphatase [Desulfomonile tiedjei]|uniref:dITP/XTP pyrophosphatase n=1 Tax=Desulfomonile tiedjei (strain ATCC 49306 / DSM 6799 / DCB-1) TaxID=706587 RepID=I4CA24_DESTA|nr:XTP/dITP diphosphatase [Desulfomonile tiedjei]AFM26415.1 non-canonical purine NTP pyrophosphatase, rdgB/HAM1 family [Desulfomonile tiedjei DSM 6799]